jgi:hypothetical protein
LLIDTEDFNKTKTNALDLTIKQIQDLWVKINCNFNEYDTPYEQQLNIVVFLQKEIYDRYRHFFIGKFKPIYNIEPLKPLSLVNFYKHKFDSAEPFAPEALMELAVLSRGIMRRFKTYIGLCLDNLTHTMTSNTDNTTNLLLEEENNIVYSSIGSSRNIGVESRGCDQSLNNHVIVSLLDVQEWIKQKTLVQDLELELHSLFRKIKA